MTRLDVEVGEMVVIGVQNQPGTILMTISDLSAINAEVKVAEADVMRLSIGMPATITLEALPGQRFPGRVVEIGASALPQIGAQAAAREFRVKVRLDRATMPLRPGLTCDAEIVAVERRNVIAVPLQSVVERAGRPGVFTIADGVVRFTPVTSGIIGGLSIEVDGVPESTVIVSGPIQALRDLEDGAAVRIDGAHADLIMREAIVQGAIAVRANPLRSALGALAIAVAVATIVIVITALDGVRRYAEMTTARTFGSDTFLIAQVASPGRVSRRELQAQLARNPPITRTEVGFLSRYAGHRVLYAPNAQARADVTSNGRRIDDVARDGNHVGARRHPRSQYRRGPILPRQRGPGRRARRGDRRRRRRRAVRAGVSDRTAASHRRPSLHGDRGAGPRRQRWRRLAGQVRVDSAARL